MSGLWLLVGSLLMFSFKSRGDFQETADSVIQGVFEAFPRGNWVLSGVLNTRSTSQNTKVTSEMFRSASVKVWVDLLTFGSQGHELRYRNDKGEGVRVLIRPRSSSWRVDLIDFKSGEPVEDRRLLFDSVVHLADLSLQFLSWKNQELVAEESVKDRRCWKIQSVAVDDESAIYSRVESWIDREYRTLLRAKAFDSLGHPAKELNVLSFQKLEDTWMLRSLEVRDLRNKIKTRLEILDAEKKAVP